MDYVVYDKESGEILRTGTCSESQLQHQAARENEAVVEGTADWTTHIVIGGVISGLPPPEVEARKARPSRFHQWDATTKSWQDNRPAAVKRAERLAEVDRQRGREEVGGFRFAGRRFDSDPASQRRILANASAAQSALLRGKPWTITWTDSQNNGVVLQADEMVELADALTEHINDCHDRAQQAKGRVK